MVRLPDVALALVGAARARCEITDLVVTLDRDYVSTHL
jgi:hypothetical protein